MVDKVEKVKRPHVNWYSLMKESGDFRFSIKFWSLKAKHPTMSNNRIAYNVLKHYYSTTSLNRVRWLGVNLADEPERYVDPNELRETIVGDKSWC